MLQFICAVSLSSITNWPYYHQGPSKRNPPTSGTRIDTRSFELCEDAVKLRLCISDTPGFGQGVNNSTCWQPVVDYLDQQFEAYLKSELSVNRTTVGSGDPYVSSLVKDTRVHACLYFVAPTGHGLHPLDVETLKHLHSKVISMQHVLAIWRRVSFMRLTKIVCSLIDDIIALSGSELYPIADCLEPSIVVNSRCLVRNSSSLTLYV